MDPEFDLNVVMGPSEPYTGIVTVMDRSKRNRYCEHGMALGLGTVFSGASATKGWSSTSRSPRQGMNTLSSSSVSQVFVTLGTDYCERLRHLYWLRYCNRVGKVAQLRTSLELDQGDLCELLVKAQEGGEEVKKNHSILNVIMERENVSMGKFRFCCSQESPAN